MSVPLVTTADGILRILGYVASVFAGFGAGIVVNVLADKVYDEESPHQGRGCRTCGEILPSTRLLPLAGFSKTNRSCKACGKTASLRAPICSVALAIIYPMLLARVILSSNSLHLALVGVFLIEALACALLAFIFAVDLEHKVILDIAVYPAITALLLVAALFDHKAFAAMLVGVIIYGGLFLFLYGLGYLIYHTEALGFGDVKLAILIGILVGWPGIVQAMVLGGLFGAAISLLLLGTGIAMRRTYIPYGIFMATGAVLALLLTPPFW